MTTHTGVQLVRAALLLCTPDERWQIARGIRAGRLLWQEVERKQRVVTDERLTEWVDEWVNRIDQVPGQLPLPLEFPAAAQEARPADGAAGSVPQPAESPPAYHGLRVVSREAT